MQMRAGGQATFTDITDDLALLDALADLSIFCVLVHVRIQSTVATTVFNDNGAAVATFFAAVHNLAIAGDLNRRARRRSIVDAFVRSYSVQNGVLAF